MRGFWVGDRSLSLLLALLVLSIFVMTPLASHAVIGSELVLAAFALMTVSGVAAIYDHRPTVIATACIAVLSIALDWWAHFGGTQGVWFADLSHRLVFALLLGAVVTYRVFGPGNVSHHRIQGAIVVYLLVGLAWGYVFEILTLVDPGSFQVAQHVGLPAMRMDVFRYFSFVTLTTLGYGDILPITPFARSLTTLEALFGQLYPAVIVARLVSLELADRRTRFPGNP
jgi:hypothetical protein